MHHTKNAPASSISCLMSSSVAKGYGLASLLGNLGKVLEVLAHTEEVRGQGVVKQEVLDLPLDIAAT